MTREAFHLLLKRQRNSGLTIRAFCLNESYSPTNFYYWKSKYRSRATTDGTDSEMSKVSEDFIPLRFPVPHQPVSPSPVEGFPEVREMNGITIELPTGTKIHFSGSVGTQAGIGFITQMYSSHVLSQ
jgi:putative transposase